MGVCTDHCLACSPRCLIRRKILIILRRAVLVCRDEGATIWKIEKVHAEMISVEKWLEIAVAVSRDSHTKTIKTLSYCIITSIISKNT